MSLNLASRIRIRPNLLHAVFTTLKFFAPQKPIATRQGLLFSCEKNRRPLKSFFHFCSSFNDGKDCMKRFCEFLRDHVMKIINFKNKKIKEQQESYGNAKICYICKKNLNINIWKIKNIVKLEIIVIIQGNIKVLCIAYAI